VPDKVRNHLLPSSLHERIKAGDGQKQVKDGQLRVMDGFRTDLAASA
jgi:hypothetical protein